MTQRDMVVIGASAGGIQALTQLISLLPPDFPGSLLVVLHMRADAPSNLPTILRRAGSLEAVFPRYDEAIRPGYIYIAPPNWHMVIQDQRVHLEDGPRENNVRPAIDPLFRSAAANFGSRVIGVILSGSLDDGIAGLALVKSSGGLTVVQDPEEAQFDSMPRHAIDNVTIDHISTISQIAALLKEQVGSVGDLSTAIQPASPLQLAEHEPTWDKQFACPDCGGVLLPMESAGVLHFRCEVGHYYSPQTLVDKQTDGIEIALWAAIRALGEKARLLHNLSERMQESSAAYSAGRFEERSQLATGQQETLERLVASLTHTEVKSA